MNYAYKNRLTNTTTKDIIDLAMIHERVSNGYYNPIHIYNNEKSYELGCCSLYDECSLVGHCISKIEGNSEKCAYNKNLKAGRVFYSKNANDFSDAVYREVLSIYKSLPTALKAYFDKLLRYFFHEKSNIEKFMKPTGKELNELISLDLLTSRPDIDYIIRCLPVRELEEIYGKEKVKYIKDKLREYNEEKSKVEKRTFRDFLSECIRSGDADISADPLFDKYIVVQLNPIYFRYFIEIAREYVLMKG